MALEFGRRHGQN